MVPGCQRQGRGGNDNLGHEGNFWVTEMFPNMAVVTAAQLSKLSPRAPGVPVRESLSERRADRRKNELALGPGPRRLAGDPSMGKSLGLAEPLLRLAAAPGPRRAQLSRPQSLASVSHHRLSPESQATCLSFRLCFFRRSATQRYEALTFAATWMHPENTMLSGRIHTQKDTQGEKPMRGNVQNR